MAEFNILIINFNSNLLDCFTKGFCNLVIRDWSGYIHNLHTFSQRILGICPALPLHVNEAIVEPTIYIFSKSKVRYKFLKTFIKFTYLLCKLCILRFHFIVLFKHHCYYFLFTQSLLRDSSVKDAMYLNSKENPSLKKSYKLRYLRQWNFTYAYTSIYYISEN